MNEEQTARILLVEDEPAIAMVLSAWMKHHGVKKVSIDHVLSPEGAKERCEGVAAIILDLKFPGWTWERTMQLVPELRQIAPVIILTGHSGGSEKDDYDFVGKAIGIHGADFCFFKDHLVGDGLDWFFRILYAAIERRFYAQRSKGLRENPEKSKGVE